MDLVESIDIIFKNLYTNIVESKGDINLIEKYIKETQFAVNCYTTVVINNDLERIKPITITKECLVH